MDRSALPPAKDFYRQNVERFRAYGNRGRGRCPFHKSDSRGRSTPFSVDLSRGLWHCFSCGAGGDVITFVRLRDGVDFITAAKTLGALRPLDSVEAEVYYRERKARQVRQQRKDNAFYESVELLAKEMEIYERVRDWAFRHHDDELQDLAEQLIAAIGTDYILLKVQYEAMR